MSNDIISSETLEFLIDEFQSSEEEIKELYDVLQTKKCVQENQQNVADVIYDILFDKAMVIAKSTDLIEPYTGRYYDDADPYFISDEYFINKALINHYGEQSFKDLTDEFVEKVDSYLGDHFEKELPSEETSYKPISLS